MYTSLFEQPETNYMKGSYKYSRNIKIPQYEIKGEKPSIDELYKNKKVVELISHINKANITDEEKKFLKIAAYRHYVFNYSKIAEYYAQASPEMQELMEESALVIIDMDDALTNGYVKLSNRLKEIRKDAKKLSEFS